MLISFTTGLFSSVTKPTTNLEPAQAKAGCFQHALVRGLCLLQKSYRPRGCSLAGRFLGLCSFSVCRLSDTEEISPNSGYLICKKSLSATSQAIQRLSAQACT